MGGIGHIKGVFPRGFGGGDGVALLEYIEDPDQADNQMILQEFLSISDLLLPVRHLKIFLQTIPPPLLLFL